MAEETRRGFLQATAALGVVAVGGPLAAEVVAGELPCPPAPAGGRPAALGLFARGSRLLVADATARSLIVFETAQLQRMRSIALDAFPRALAITPNGRTALVAVSDPAGIAVVDLTAGKVRARLDGLKDPVDVRIAADGRTAWVADRAAGSLVAFSLPDGRRRAPLALGAAPGTLALTRRGTRALVALTGAGSLVDVDLRSGRIVRRHAVALPHAVAATPDGRRALVTQGGLGSEHVTVVDLVRGTQRRLRVGADPTGVHLAPNGRYALVAAFGGAEVHAVDLRRGRVRRALKVDAGPSALAVDAERGRLFVTCRRAATVRRRRLPSDLRGATR